MTQSFLCEYISKIKLEQLDKAIKIIILGFSLLAFLLFQIESNIVALLLALVYSQTLLKEEINSSKSLRWQNT